LLYVCLASPYKVINKSLIAFKNIALGVGKLVKQYVNKGSKIDSLLSSLLILI
jgi:hypothetical protein